MGTEVTIDFETRSPVKLKDHGAFRYAEHPDTEPMCLSAAVNADRPIVWVPSKFSTLVSSFNVECEMVDHNTIIDAILSADKIVAQNSIFEWVIWNWVMTRYGWPTLPMEKLHDTMAQLAYHALPLNLEKAGEVLGLTIKKDMNGHRVMMKLCKPRQPLKKERANDPRWVEKNWWHEDPEDIETLINYCCTDVEAERMIHHKLPDLPPGERSVWLLDQLINTRGVHVDMESVGILIERVETHRAERLKQFIQLTDGSVTGPQSYVALKKWVNANTGLSVPSVDKAHTADLLKTDLPEKVRAVLEIKEALSKSSVAKHRALIDRSSWDSRFRGIALYHGATTGRWAGRGVQVHNLPRDSYDEAEYDTCVQLFKDNRMDIVQYMFGDPFFAASRCVRGSFTAAPGHELLCADFSAVEGRALAHLAGETDIIQAYIDGRDMYKVAAMAILGKAYEDITKDERQSPGKIIELAAGFGGSAGAVRQFGGGEGMTDEEIVQKWITPWRKKRERTVKFWYGLEQAAKEAIENPGEGRKYGPIQYYVEDEFLKCELPNGRRLHYYHPEIKENLTRHKRAPHPFPCLCRDCSYLQKSIEFEGMRTIGDRTVPDWTMVETYGGKLTENVVQAFCRDLLAEAMLRLEAAGFPLVLHVHDEAVAEVPIGSKSLEEFISIMEIVPAWAEGMPIKAAGWIGKRYRK